MLEKPEDREVVQEHALAMVQCKVVKQLELLEGRRLDDPDIVEDLTYLNEKLASSVQDLRSVFSSTLSLFAVYLSLLLVLSFGVITA